MPRPAPSPASDSEPPRTRRPYARRLPPAERREQLLDAALAVILELGYSGVSIEAIARRAGVTRPVVYDHFPNLGLLLSALIEREERYSLDALDFEVPAGPVGDPVDAFTRGARRFLDAVVSRPATWRIILLPPAGTPQVVRTRVEQNRARTLERLERLVRWSLALPQVPDDLDVELTARTIRDLAEEAGRLTLTDPQRYSPARYESFARKLMALVLIPSAAADEPLNGRGPSERVLADDPTTRPRPGWARLREIDVPG